MNTKKTQTEGKIFIVETISTFKIRYAIRCKSLEDAMDTVACEEADELDQNWLGETIFGGKEITEKQFLNDEIKDVNIENNPQIWTKQRKLEMIHTVDYSK